MACSGPSIERYSQFIFAALLRVYANNAEFCKAMALLMNDDIAGAETALEGGHSSFHKVFPP